MDVLAAASWSSTCLICNLSGFSSYITPHWGVCLHGDGQSATASPYRLPRCSSIPLFPLIVSPSVNADSPLVGVTRPPVSHHPPHTHLQAQVEGRRSTHLLVEEARHPTDGGQRRGRSSRLGQEFWRERETKDEEGTKTGGCGGCMWGLKKGRRRLTECSDTSWQGFQYTFIWCGDLEASKSNYSWVSSLLSIAPSTENCHLAKADIKSLFFFIYS